MLATCRLWLTCLSGHIPRQHCFVKSHWISLSLSFFLFFLASWCCSRLSSFDIALSHKGKARPFFFHLPTADSFRARCAWGAWMQVHGCRLTIVHMMYIRSVWLLPWLHILSLVAWSFKAQAKEYHVIRPSHKYLGYSKTWPKTIFDSTAFECSGNCITTITGHYCARRLKYISIYVNTCCMCIYMYIHMCVRYNI